MRNILISFTRQGGHLFPALVLKEELEKNNSNLKIILIGDKTSKHFLKEYNILTLPLEGLNLISFKQMIGWTAKFIKSIIFSIRIILKFRPSLVIGFGGYISFPIVFLSSLFFIPTLIHEQNLIPGMSTRLLAPFVNKVAVSFKETKKYLFFKKNVIFSGNLIRSQILKGVSNPFKRLSLEKDKFTILIMGGSLGSRRINEVAFKMLSRWKNENIQIIHITGRSNYESMLKLYKLNGIRVKLYPFLEDIASAYYASDLTISRAGATTLAEINAVGLPAILIPYPGARSHQLINAQYLKRLGQAYIIPEERFSAKTLRNLIQYLFSNSWKLKEMRRHRLNLNQDKSLAILCREISLLLK